MSGAAAIRRSVPADFPAVLALLRAAGLPTEDLASNSVLDLWVLEAEGGLAGAVALEGTFADGRLLRSLVVAPAHQHRGFARALVERAEREARSQGAERVALLTETAQAMFEHLGYRLIERGSAPRALLDSAEARSLCPTSAACMAKRL